jgi:hypothetical protein
MFHLRRLRSREFIFATDVPRELEPLGRGRSAVSAGYGSARRCIPERVRDNWLLEGDGFPQHRQFASRGSGRRPIGLRRPIQNLPTELQPQIECAEQFAGLGTGSVVEALVNRYPPGASVGWHNDAPVCKAIIGVSLGASCTIQFKTRGTKELRMFERILMPRSAYIVRDGARDDWQHRIPPTRSERFSLTFRSLESAKRPGGSE